MVCLDLLKLGKEHPAVQGQLVRVIWAVVAMIPVLPGLPAYVALWLLTPLE